MKLVQVAEQNKKYYTKEFIHGFNTGAKNQYEADKKDAERRGRWIRKAYNDNSCSLCGWNVWVNTGNYCPNCGARMEE